jgi:hypothetical protein
MTDYKINTTSLCNDGILWKASNHIYTERDYYHT